MKKTIVVVVVVVVVEVKKRTEMREEYRRTCVHLHKEKKTVQRNQEI